MNNVKVIRNGRIWLGSSHKDAQTVSWFSFDADKGVILKIGNPGEEYQFSEYPESTPTIDVGGSWVFPGFHDSHIHLAAYGLRTSSLDLSGCSSIVELKQRLKEYVSTKKRQADGVPISWIVGYGWNHAQLGRLPTADDLDEICADIPVVLKRICLHICAVNTLALRVGGFDQATTDPSGGKIDRDAQGKPTGILKEKANFLMGDCITYTHQEKKDAIRAGLRRCLREGVTAVQTNEWDTDSWSIYKELREGGELPIRIFYTMMHSHLDSYADVKTPTVVDSFLCCERVKIIADGALGSETAALSTPYKSSSDNKGILCYSQDELTAMVKRAVDKGFRMEIHAIGDACAEQVVNSFTECPSFRPNLTHCQFLSASLVSRMANLGVVANVQPSMVASDGCWVAEKVESQLLDYSYAWKTLNEAGIVLAGGSDAPVEEPKPNFCIYDAVFRFAPRTGSRAEGDGAKGGEAGDEDQSDRTISDRAAFRPEERLDVGVAIDAFTQGSAWAAGREKELGKIAADFRADFVVVEGDNDVVEDPRKWLNTRIDQVWVGGVRRM